MPDLLIELFSEEIPARMQSRAAEDLKRLVTDGLVEAGLTYGHAGSFSTPRRLVLTVEGLLGESPTLREERKGPRVDAPDKALEGFLRSTGLTKDQLDVRDEKKGQVYFAVIERPGRPAAEIVAEVLEAAIRNFPWPKSMRWGAGSLRWVRPLHSIICLLTDETGASVVPMEVDGIRAGDTTEGHRFMGSGRFSVTSFEDYEAKLKRSHVILRADERVDHIWVDAHNRAFAQGFDVVEDKGLLSEVAGLVEWPVVLMGDIGADFLGLPPEVLQTSMKEHQKFFSVKNPKTGRIEKFVTVANIETADEGATILAGNQKVLAARLSDAKFFWENDLRTVERQGMSGLAAGLANVTFHAKLGTQGERVERIAALAREIAPMVGAKPDLAEEAARICKADLTSEMVYEFPELQGIMGRYYAAHAGHDSGVPEACEEHYSPLGPSDAVPEAPVSVAVALADKIDTLTGFWAIDEKPTGSKDPYALRRAALGVIRLVLGNNLRVSLENLLTEASQIRIEHRFKKHFESFWPSLMTNIDQARQTVEEHEAAQKGEISSPASLWAIWEKVEASQRVTEEHAKKIAEAYIARPMQVEFQKVSNLAADLLSFFHDRLKVHLRDEGIRHDVIDACLAMPGNDDLTLLVKRARALSDFLNTDDGENLVLGFRRANNILAQAEEKDGVEYSFGADPKFAEDPAEVALFEALDAADRTIEPAMKDEDFETAMGAMAGLRSPIDVFFEAVQINTDNEIVRRNRLNLLSRIRATCLAVADLTKLDG
ncbi:glycine--tRNA ligase subunit beta [Pseudoruegeria sp. HB172150]|uniref:glycine--tRNA ligase subunit beta n=1 Tax=Pseudoruegeria sp. HB172150 TaxID=2721164 RepID=UPI001555E365|nr:glycine--tRNA ligase subunit beta [Pseudoruegeria sp. HB172150]